MKIIMSKTKFLIVLQNLHKIQSLLNLHKILIKKNFKKVKEIENLLNLYFICINNFKKILLPTIKISNFKK